MKDENTVRLVVVVDVKLNCLHTLRKSVRGLAAVKCPTTQSWFAFHTAVSAHLPTHLGFSRSVFVDAGVDPCALQAHLAVMVIPRTHCNS